MKRLAMLAAVGCLAAQAVSAEPVPGAQQLVDHPETLTNELVRIPNIACVDDGNIICVAKVDGRLLKIDAVSLGHLSSSHVVDKLNRGCRGSANLDRSACVFTIAFKSTTVEKTTFQSSNGTVPVVIAHAVEIELFEK